MCEHKARDRHKMEITDRNDGSIEDAKIEIKKIFSELNKSKSPINNPFKAHLEINNRNKLKLMLFSFLVPLRLMLLFLLLVVCHVVSSVCLLGYKEDDPPKPFTGFREKGQNLLYILTRVMCGVCGFYRINVKGWCFFRSISCF